ncbi:MAG: hypothetical protein ACOYIR_09350, partial [Christensenellales bacterium]
ITDKMTREGGSRKPGVDTVAACAAACQVLRFSGRRSLSSEALQYYDCTGYIPVFVYGSKPRHPPTGFYICPKPKKPA